MDTSGQLHVSAALYPDSPPVNTEYEAVWAPEPASSCLCREPDPPPPLLAIQPQPRYYNVSATQVHRGKASLRMKEKRMKTCEQQMKGD
jgi:hypothetical protein